MIQKIPFLILFFLVTACASEAPPGFEKISSTQLPLSLPGVDLKQPCCAQWYIHKTENSIEFFKRDTKTHSYWISLEVGKSPKFSSPAELFAINKLDWDKTNTNPRYELQATDVQYEPKFGKNSVRVHHILIDRNAPNKGTEAYLMEDEYGYRYVHPYYSNAMISIFYSERFAPGEQAQNAKALRDEFVDNIKPKPFINDR